MSNINCLKLALLGSAALVLVSPAVLAQTANEPQSAQAQEAQAGREVPQTVTPVSAEDIRKLGPVTSTGTKTPEEAAKLPFTVNVVGQEEIEQRRPYKLDDLLRDIPGVDGVAGPRRSSQTPSVRGVDGNRVLVTVDGARQNFDAGHKGRIFFEPDILKQVDVLKGAASVLYGSGAIGGVIATTTKDAADFLEPGETAGIRLKAGWRSAADEFLYSGTAFAKPHDRIDMLANITSRNANDIRMGGGETLEFSEEDLLSGLFKFGVEPFKHHRFQLSYSFFNQDGDIPANPSVELPNLVDNPLVRRDNRHRQLIFSYKGNDPSTPLLAPSVTLYNTDLEIKERRIDGGAAREDFSDQNTKGLDIYNTSRFMLGGMGHTLTYGVEFYREKQDGTRNGVNRPQFPASKGDVLGVYVQDAVAITETVTFVGGIRYDGFWRDPDGAQDKVHDDAISPRVGAIWQATPWLAVYGNAGLGFRAPSMTELFVTGTHFAFNTFIPNPTLEPEKSTGYEAGVRLKFDDVATKGDRLTMSAAFHDTYYKNFITLDIQPGLCPFPGPPLIDLICGTTTPVNLDKARVWGIEAEARYDMRYAFATLGGSLIRGRDTAADTWIDTIPADKIVGTYGFKLPEWDVVAGIRHELVFDQHRIARGSAQPKTDGYFLTGIFASWVPSMGPLEGLRVDAGIDNIFDKDYRRHLQSIPEPGFDAGIAVSYTLKL
ncbi:MAG: TonB-dependent hemoglobin/transferrin/lactoferrin family receptor [Alphaproteobacteria bacterium]|jgi:hemoglobin/transferrin/lactoferrin receptor protein|nr:TonB-dependent hemoglobin/transferrin/lactoferrin family receptor [Alphaproteobacteria bacterium]